MQVQEEQLRQRMAELTSEDLHGIVWNARGMYTEAATQAARLELASRPNSVAAPTESEEVDGPRSPAYPERRFLTRWEMIPAGLRSVFWFATILALSYTAAFLISIAMLFVGAESTPTMARIIRYAGYAIVTWWIVIAIKREYVHGRTLLIAATAASLVYAFVFNVILMRSLEAVNALTPPALALCYLIFSNEVAEYYRGRRRDEATSSCGAL